MGKPQETKAADQKPKHSGRTDKEVCEDILCEAHKIAYGESVGTKKLSDLGRERENNKKIGGDKK